MELVCRRRLLFEAVEDRQLLAGMAPTALSLSNLSIVENSAPLTQIGTLVTVDPDTASTPSTNFSYSFANTATYPDNSNFAIAGDKLQGNALFDFETKSSYQICLQTTDLDGNSLATAKTFTISIVNADDPPTNISLSSSSINEGLSLGSLVGTLSDADQDFTPPEADPTFSLPSGQASNSFFNIINSNQLVTAHKFDYETESHFFNIVVTVTDGGPLQKTFNKTLTVAINNVNEPITDIQLSNSTVPENAANTVVGTLTPTDPDGSGTYTYDLVSGNGSTDNALFTVVGGQLKTIGALNYESGRHLPVYSVRVSANDGTVPAEKAFTIQLTDVDEPPTGFTLSNASFAENLAIGTAIGDLTVVDPDTSEPAPTYSITGVSSGNTVFPNNYFAVNGLGQLTVNRLFDFEAGPTTYNVSVLATDGGTTHASVTGNFALTLTNVNDAPTTVTLSNLSINENLAAGAEVGVLDWADQEKGNQTPTFSLAPGGVDNNNFTIVGNAVQTRAAFNFEAKSSYGVRIRVTDSGTPSLYVDRDFTISVNDVNEMPTDITLSNATIAENLVAGIAVGNLSVSDPDLASALPPGSTLTFSLPAGKRDNDLGNFAIVGNQLVTSRQFDYETDKRTYVLVVRATDQWPASTLIYDKTITVNVTSADDAPTDIVLSGNTISENQPVGTVIGTLSNLDQDIGTEPAATYFLMPGQGNNAYFTISGSQLTTARTFDYEKDSGNLTVVVQTIDGGSSKASLTKTFTLSLLNLNDAPTDIVFTGNTSIAENTVPVPVLLGNLSMIQGPVAGSTDEDTTGNFTYSLVSGVADNASFTISGNQLQAAVPFNYEVKNSYAVQVRVTDSGPTADPTPASFIKTINIQVTNVNEPITDINLSNSQFYEGASGTLIGTVVPTDPDVGQTYTYNMQSGGGGTDNALFTLNATTGELYGNTTFNYEGPHSTVYKIYVRTVDGAFFKDKLFTLQVLNINEDPVSIGLTPVKINENLASSTVGILSTADPDIGDTFTYRLISGTGSTDNGAFAINSNQLQTLGALDFETKSSFSVRVRSTDSGGLSVESVFAITATDVNEAPFDLVLNSAVSVNENAVSGQTLGTFLASQPITPGLGNETQLLTFGSGVTGGTFTLNVGGITVGPITFDAIPSNQVANLQSALNGNFASYGSGAATVAAVTGTTSYSVTFGGNLSFADVPQIVANSASLVGGNVVPTTVRNGFGNEVQTVTLGGSTGTVTFNFHGNNSTALAYNTANLPTIAALQSTLGNIPMLANNFSVLGNQGGPFTLIYNNGLGFANVGLLDKSITGGTTAATATLWDGQGSETQVLSFTGGAGNLTVALNGISATAPLQYIAGNAPTAAQLTAHLNTNSAMDNDFNVVGGPGGPFTIVFRNNLGNIGVPQMTATVGNGTVVPAISTKGDGWRLIDPDSNVKQTFTYTLVSGTGSDHNAYFRIAAPGGVPTLLTGNLTLDYETTPICLIRVRVTDQAGLTFDKQLSVILNNLNEAPSDITMAPNPTLYPENIMSSGNLVATVTGVDQDAGQTFTYSLVGGNGSTDNGWFTIPSGTNQIVTNYASGRFNFEAKSALSVRVRATDQGGLYTEKAFAITLKDQDDPITDVRLSDITITEDASDARARTIANTVATVTTVDEDRGENAPALYLVPETSELQRVTIGNTVVGGTFLLTLDFGGSSAWTNPITFSSVARTMADAIEAELNATLSGMNPSFGNTAIQVLPISATNYVVEFGGNLSGTNLPLMTSNSGGLVGGTATTVAMHDGGGSALQLLTLTNPVDGDRYRFNFGGQDATVNLVYASATPPTAADVQTSLESIPLLAGNVVVMGPVGGPFSIAFRNALAFTAVPQIDVNRVAGTGGIPTISELSAKQLLTLDTPADGDQYQFSFGGQDGTINLVYSAATPPTAADVQTSLESVPLLATNVVVTGSAGGPFLITFRNALALTSVPQIGVTCLSGTGTPTIQQMSSGAGNEMQSLDLSSVAGPFTLSFDGTNASGALVYAAGVSPTAAQLKAHLDTIPALNGQTVVWGDDGGPFSVVFRNTPAYWRMPQLSSTEAVAVTTTSAGDPNAMRDLVDPVTGLPIFVLTNVAGTGNFTLTSGIRTVSGVSKVVKFNNEARNTFRFYIRSEDSGQIHLGLMDPQTITVTNVNEPPTDITLGGAGLHSASIPDSVTVGTVVGQLNTVDPDENDYDRGGDHDGDGSNYEDNWTYTLPAGVADNGAFRINQGNTTVTNSKGVARTVTTANLETNVGYNAWARSAYTIHVVATDSANDTFERDITINITPDGQWPTDLAVSQNLIPENQPAGRVVGTLSTVDHDIVTDGDVFSYALTAEQGTGKTYDNAKFQIVGTQLVARESLDYEKQNRYQVYVATRDSIPVFHRISAAFPYSYGKLLTIVVGNVNEAPTDFGPTSFNVIEHRAAGTVVGAFTTTDPDVGQGFTYSLVAGAGATDNAAFTIVGNQLRTTSVLNYTAQSSYSVRVRTTDDGSPSQSIEKVIAVNVVRSNDTTTPGLYSKSSSTFYLRNDNSPGYADNQFTVTSPTTEGTPLSGDWDGDGLVTTGLYDPTTSRFYLKRSNSAGPIDETIYFGAPAAGWLPVVGDWDGDGKDTIGLYSPTTATFYLRNTNTSGIADITFNYGQPRAGWVPLAGDWDGDGKTGIGAYNPATAWFYVKNTLAPGYADTSFPYGPVAGRTPLAGDWDGDGKCTVGLFETAASKFYLKNTLSSGYADLTFPYGPAGQGWLPVVGNWVGPKGAVVAAQGLASTTATTLTDSEVSPILAQAVSRYYSLGVTSPILASVKIVIADLPGSILGIASADTITVDRDAAGYGWFVDTTPADDVEFTNTGANTLRAIDAKALDRIDLLTVVERELGDLVGLSDLGPNLDRLMSATLPTSARRNASATDLVFGSG